MTTQAKPTSTRQAGGATITGIYGNGGDGVLTVVGTYTQTTERHWQTLTIPSGGAYKPAGHRTMVRGTCTIDAGGSFNDDGNSGASGGAAEALRLKGDDVDLNHLEKVAAAPAPVGDSCWCFS